VSQKPGPTAEQRLLLSEVELGVAVEQFARSTVGKYLIDRSKGEAEDAIERLKTADPDNAKLIRDLQNEIWRAETFEKYLTDAILGGRNAEEQLIHTDVQPDGD